VTNPLEVFINISYDYIRIEGMIVARKSKKLEEIRELINNNKENINLEKLKIEELEVLTKKFAMITDERYQPNVLHNIGDVIMIVILAVLANCDEWKKIEIFCQKKEEWLKNFLSLKNGIPSIDTIQRILIIIKPVELYKVCINYFIEKIEILSPKRSDEVDIRSLDGKTTNGSARKKTDQDEIKSINTMSAYSTMYGVSLTHDYIGDKSNEIPMGPELIKQLNAPNCIFTWDALNTQVKTVAAISVEADYVGALKKNQQTFYNEVKEFLDDKDVIAKIIENEQYLKIVKKEHNAIVTREYYMTNDIDWFYDKNKWKKLKSFGKEDKTIEKLDGTISYETRYFITSLNEDIDLFSYAIKAHWGVENNLHAPLDIVFKEDKNKTLEKNGAKSLGVIRRIVLIILKLAQPYYGDSLSSMRYKLSLDFDNEIEKIFKLLDMTALKQQLISKSD